MEEMYVASCMRTCFELKKMRCTFLKQILKQDKDSQIYKFFELQLNNPVKGDWVSTCLSDLLELEIKQTLEEIKSMSAYKFKNLLKSKIEIKALEYLQRKRGSKGQEIECKTLEMSEYLLPFNSKLNIEEKRRLFEMRNRMSKIPINFGNKEEKCICGAVETMPHIYTCNLINNTKPNINDYNEIYNGNLMNQIDIFRRMETNLEKR